MINTVTSQMVWLRALLINSYFKYSSTYKGYLTYLFEWKQFPDEWLKSGGVNFLF